MPEVEEAGGGFCSGGGEPAYQGSVTQSNMKGESAGPFKAENSLCARIPGWPASWATGNASTAVDQTPKTSLGACVNRSLMIDAGGPFMSPNERQKQGPDFGAHDYPSACSPCKDGILKHLC